MPEQSCLRILDDRKPIWRRPDDPIVDEVIIPALQVAESFDCMVGFFGGGALRELSHGLASYIIRSREPLRLLVSPIISDGDQEAIRVGLKNPAQVLEEAITFSLTDESTLASALAQHTKKCLAYLIAVGRLRMKVVLVKGAKFHVKEWIFRNQYDIVVLSGSANFTGQALANNVEQLHLHRSWRSEDGAFACRDATAEFDRYWSNQKPHAVATDLPFALQEGLLRSYDTDEPPSIEEYHQALIAEGLGSRVSVGVSSSNREPVFAAPEGMVWEVGPYAHQGEAVHAWEANGRRGILAMATGAGKTITALVAAWRLYREAKQLLILITAPTRPLVSQWDSEARLFGLTPYSVGTENMRSRLKQIDTRLSDLELGLSSVETLIVTNNLLNDTEFQRLIQRFQGEVLLIADEVHNLGSAAFLNAPPDFIPHRLGLSATPERQYDSEGSEGLVEFFGDVVFEFGLEKAIGICLVPYDYHLHPVRLTDDEAATYKKLSEQIRNLFLASGEQLSGKDEERLQLLLNRRRLVLENAEGKLYALQCVLEPYVPDSLRHSLIYTTDKDPAQLLQVNAMLTNMGVRFHQITAEETSQARLVGATLNAFRRGHIQALTAKRVLDEGLNVPEITTAFVLASTTVRRQWIQRRGRVLRMCHATNKQFGVIHDFVVLPPPDMPRDEDVKRLISDELARCDEFTELARNRAARGGPREVLQDIRLAYVV